VKGGKRNRRLNRKKGGKSALRRIPNRRESKTEARKGGKRTEKEMGTTLCKVSTGKCQLRGRPRTGAGEKGWIDEL